MTDIVWTKITDDTPRGTYLLYFPPWVGRNHTSPEMWSVERHPVHFPRKPTHWAPLTTPKDTD